MDRPDLDGLPEVAVPQGYELLTDPGGIVREWTELLSHAFGPGAHFEPEQWQDRFIAQPQYNPKGAFFVRHLATGELCATAFCWLDDPGEREIGRVHWVGVHEAHRGVGLGRLVTVAVLHHMRERGLQRAMLETQAFRLPAIRLYLSLRFTPTPRNETEAADWEWALTELGLR